MTVRARWWVLGPALLVLLVLITLPLRLVLDASGMGDRGFSARQVSGSIWAGRLVDARLGGIRLGTLDVGLAPASLLRGRVEADFARPADALEPALTGRLRLAGGGQGVVDARGTVSLFAALGLVPLDRVELDGVTLTFDRAGRCVDAAGRVALFAGVPGLDMTQGLAGPLRCNGGRSALRLASQSGMEQLLLDVGGGGDYRARLRIGLVRDPLLAAALRLAGFVPGGDAMVLTTRGQF